MISRATVNGLAFGPVTHFTHTVSLSDPHPHLRGFPPSQCGREFPGHIGCALIGVI